MTRFGNQRITKQEREKEERDLLQLDDGDGDQTVVEAPQVSGEDKTEDREGKNVFPFKLSFRKCFEIQ